MQILVNGENLDFEMTQKTSLTDILKYISDWARQDATYILDYRIDGKEKVSGADYHSENMNTLEVSLGSAENLFLEHILELEEYLDKMGNHLAVMLQNQTSAGADVDLSSEVLDGLAWIHDSAETILNRFGQPPMAELELLQAAPHEIASELSGVLQVLIEIRQSLEAWKKNIIMKSLSGEEKTQYCKKFLGEIEGSLERLEGIVQNFTIGKEAEALGEFELYLIWLSEGLALLASREEESIALPQEARNKLDEIKGLLPEIHDALENADFVTLADILDYDLREMITGLVKETASIMAP